MEYVNRIVTLTDCYICLAIYNSRDILSADAMALKVTFQYGGLPGSVVKQLPKTIQLRDLQKDLCQCFKQPFPKKLAKLTVYDKTYDAFTDYPFENVIGEEIEAVEIEAVVAFENTTDPYFYDVADRAHMKYTIEDEVQWESETERGETCLTFKEWMRSKAQQTIKQECALVTDQ